MQLLGYNWLQILTLIPGLGSIWCGLMKLHVGAVHARCCRARLLLPCTPAAAAAKKAAPATNHKSVFSHFCLVFLKDISVLGQNTDVWMDPAGPFQYLGPHAKDQS